MSRWKNALQTRDEVFQLKRQAVLREANRIIGRRGYHNTSLDDIAEALEVSKGTLYNYVHDKQEILFECHLLGLAVGDRAIEFALAHGRSGLERIRLMLRAYLTWMNGPSGAGGVMTEVSALRPADRAVIVARRDATQTRLIELVDQGLADGSIRPTDPRILVYTLMGAANSTAAWFSPGGRLSNAEVATLMADILTLGVATPKAAKARPLEIAVPELDISTLRTTAGAATAPTAKRARRASPAPAAAPARKRRSPRAPTD